jgi:hypothetical protein
MPRFRLNITAKTLPNSPTPTKDILRVIVRAKLAPLKARTTAYESNGNNPYTILCVDFKDEAVSGYKDWSAQHLQGILDEFKANGIEPCDFSVGWNARNPPPPLVLVRVDEKIEVAGL